MFAVRETGQRIAQRLVRERFLGVLAVGDVASADDDAANGVVVDAVLDGKLERAHLALGMPYANFNFL